MHSLLLCIDLDRFKEVNDLFGHSIGDALLRRMSQRFAEVAKGAFLARVGGDEFTLIVTKGALPGAAAELAEALVAAAARPFEIEGRQIGVGASLGVAIYPDDGSAETILASADAAMYSAKAEGRGKVRFFDRTLSAQMHERHLLMHDLVQAIERNEFEVYYQPQVARNGEIIGFEALLRWNHATRGMVSPATFIPIAEESGRIVAIGKWVMREACREAASWGKPLNIAVNLSPLQFRQDDLPEIVHEVLLESGLAPERLELEITEGVLVDNVSRAASILRRLKSRGVSIAIDDFGTGYSSLSYLQALPFDKIKIDQSFIWKLQGDSQSSAIVRAIIALGHGLGLSVIAEGVETAAQLAFLISEGCDETQGYLHGRPAPTSHYADTVAGCFAERTGTV